MCNATPRLPYHCHAVYWEYALWFDYRQKRKRPSAKHLNVACAKCF